MPGFSKTSEQELRTALHAPIVIKYSATSGQLPKVVINPEIPLEEFKINVAKDDNGALTITGSTPRLELHSVATDPDSALYIEQLSKLKELYGNHEVMCKYAFGGIKSAEETEARFKILSERLVNGNPYSAVFATYKGPGEHAGKLVGMFTLGHGEIAGEAEFAAVEDPSFWNKGFCTEMALLFFFLKRDLRFNGNNFDITNTIDGQKVTQSLTTVSGTSRMDNYGNLALRSLLFSSVGKNTKRYGDGEQERDIFREVVDGLDKVLVDSLDDRTQSSDKSSTYYTPIKKIKARL